MFNPLDGTCRSSLFISSNLWIWDGKRGLYSGYLLPKYSMIVQIEVSAQVIYSESCEEWGNACIVVCIPIIELFIGALHISKGVVFLKALGSIAVLPIVPGYMGRIIMNPQYLDSNFSLSSSDVYSFETSISGSINENRMQLRE